MAKKFLLTPECACASPARPRRHGRDARAGLVTCHDELRRMGPIPCPACAAAPSEEPVQNSLSTSSEPASGQREKGNGMPIRAPSDVYGTALTRYHPYHAREYLNAWEMKCKGDGTRSRGVGGWGAMQCTDSRPHTWLGRYSAVRSQRQAWENKQKNISPGR